MNVQYSSISTGTDAPAAMRDTRVDRRGLSSPAFRHPGPTLVSGAVRPPQRSQSTKIMAARSLLPPCREGACLIYITRYFEPVIIASTCAPPPRHS